MNHFASVDDVDKHTLTDTSYNIFVADGQFWPTLGVKYGYDHVDGGPSRIEVNRFRAYNAAVHPIASGILSMVWLGILLAVLVYICQFSLWKVLIWNSVNGFEAVSAKLSEAGHSFSMAICSVAINSYAQVSEQMPSDPVTWIWVQGAQFMVWCQTQSSTLMTWFADEDGPTPTSTPTPPTPPAAANVAPPAVSSEHPDTQSLASLQCTFESYSDRAVALASTQDEDLLYCARRIANSAALIAEYVAARTVYPDHASYYHYHHHFHPVSADSSITEEEYYARQELGAQPTAPTAVSSAAAAPPASGVDLGSMYGSEEAESRNRSRITYYFLRA